MKKTKSIVLTLAITSSVLFGCVAEEPTTEKELAPGGSTPKEEMPVGDSTPKEEPAQAEEEYEPKVTEREGEDEFVLAELDPELRKMLPQLKASADIVSFHLAGITSENGKFFDDPNDIKKLEDIMVNAIPVLEEVTDRPPTYMALVTYPYEIEQGIAIWFEPSQAEVYIMDLSNEDSYYLVPESHKPVLAELIKEADATKPVEE